MLKNCSECGRVFAHPARSLCEQCYQDEQAAFNAVKEYLQKHPRATVAEVAMETEVSVDKIYEYIREGRLSVVPSDAKLSCEICGTEIASGRVCNRCRLQLSKKTKREPEQKEEPAKSRTSRIHYLDQIKDRR